MLEDLTQTAEPKMLGIHAASIKYKVSKGTVILAFRHLEQIDVIEPAAKGMKRRINRETLKEIIALQKVKLHLALFVASTSLNESSELMSKTYEAVQKMCVSESIDLKFIKAPSSMTDLRALLSTLKPQMIVLYVSTTEVSEMIASTGIPTIGIGSSCPLISNVSVSHTHLMVSAFRKAREHGHQRISAILWNKPDHVRQTLISALEEHFSECKQEFSTGYHLPSLHGNSVGQFHHGLESIFLHTPPSCIILSVFSDLLMAQSFFTSKNISIPDDVSVILLSEDHHLCYVLPTIAHFDLSPDLIAEIALQKLKEQVQEPIPPRETLIPPVWVEGASLGSA